MCGIAAILSRGPNAPPVAPEELAAMLLRMAPRGPDGDGAWISKDGSIGLGHRRLAIIDTSESGAQPMWDTSGRFVITFNGEIYNYRELRAELEAGGYAFRTQSDTEVILALHDREGPASVRKLRGMFAFAIWDNAERRLFAARDPFGIKPLYYHEAGGVLRLASQVKTLLAGGAVQANRSAAAEVGFLLLGYVPDPHSWIESVHALPAGCTLLTGPHGPPRVERYFDPATELAEADARGPAGAERRDNVDLIRAALSDSIAHHMIADVDVGAFLSAGLDSTAIVGLASEAGFDKLRTTTLGFEEFTGTPDDEVPLAENVARAYATDHRTVRVTAQSFAKEREHLLDQMDQPSIDGVNTYFVSKATATGGLKVAMSGLGGDELLGGYPSFRQVPALVSKLGWIPFGRAVGRAARVVTGPLIRHLTSPKYAGVLEYGTSMGDAYLLRRGLFMPWELPEILGPEAARDGWETLDLRTRLETSVQRGGTRWSGVSALELSWYMNGQLLRDADWAGMAHSLEIRVPFVDVSLFRTLAPAIVSSAPPTKHDLSRVCGDAMPDAVRARAKTGFTIPVRDWLGADDAAAPTGRGLRGWARYIRDNAA